jgi:hypothetical protein
MEKHSSDSLDSQDRVEQWRPVPIAKFSRYYEVSDMGRVRTLVKRMRYPVGYVLGKHQIPQGYCYVKLSIDAGKPKQYYVHRLVLEAFAPIKGCRDLEVNHENGLRDDNRLENLGWMTHADNIKHSINVLKTFKGFQSEKGKPPSNSKMTPAMVKEIRALASSGVHYKEIAKSYPMTPGGIHHIITRRTWKHVE